MSQADNSLLCSLCVKRISSGYDPEMHLNSSPWFDHFTLQIFRMILINLCLAAKFQSQVSVKLVHPQRLQHNLSRLPPDFSSCFMCLESGVVGFHCKESHMEVVLSCLQCGAELSETLEGILHFSRWGFSSDDRCFKNIFIDNKVISFIRN